MTTHDFARNEYSEAEIKQHVEQFEAQTLPKEAWTHEGHLIVAISYCLRYDVDAALEILRTRIASYNESVGGMNTDTDGYHETITRFWLLVAHKFIGDHPEMNLQELCTAFCKAPEGDRNYLLSFYSRELLFSVQARRHWVEPDTMQL